MGKPALPPMSFEVTLCDDEHYDPCPKHGNDTRADGGSIMVTIGNKTEEVYIYGCVWCGTWCLDA